MWQNVASTLIFPKSAVLRQDPSPIKVFCSLYATSSSDYLPEYFCGDKFNPACQSCKANDSSWDPDDPFSAFPSPSQPTSLVSHWLIPPRQQPPQNPSSILSDEMDENSDKDNETKMENLMSKEDIAELMEE